jgi:hypothetical protein
MNEIGRHDASSGDVHRILLCFNTRCDPGLKEGSKEETDSKCVPLPTD